MANILRKHGIMTHEKKLQLERLERERKDKENKDKESKENKEGYHITTRKVYNFRSGVWESDYSNKQEQTKAMTEIMEKHVPQEVEQKTITPEIMDELTQQK